VTQTLTQLLITCAILWLLIFGAVYGFSRMVPKDSRAGKLARHALCALLAFIPTMVEKIRGKGK
jgi:hypothetical protein